MDLKVNELLIIDYKLLSKLYIFDLAVNIIEPPRTPPTCPRLFGVSY